MRLNLLRKLLVAKEVDASAFGFGFGLSLKLVGEADCPILAQALTRLVDRAKGDIVLIIDEIQHALGREPGRALLIALKAATLRASAVDVELAKLNPQRMIA